MPAYLAVDLGAESGRVLRGEFDGERIAVEEVHRFANVPIRRPDGLYWDIDALYADALDGIAKGAGRGARSVGVDAWGNDFGLLDDAGALLATPWHHRTSRTAGMVERLLSRVDADELYAVTGTQFLPITMACQLLAMQGSPALAQARRLATIPDLFASWLSGRPVAEQTIASTGQLWDIHRGRWAAPVITRLGLPECLFATEIVEPGTPVGPSRVDLPAELGVVAVAGHDTACAVAAVPAERETFAYVSCGTWSVVGLELPRPITTPAARLARFGNEVGVGDTVRFLSNVNGLWLLQECRRTWTTAGEGPSYAALVAAADRAQPYRSLIDPDHPSLLGAGDMPALIAARCRATGEQVPGTQGEVVRCVLDSLACKYRWVLDQAAALVGRPVDVVHVVGGGAANSLLCQLTADVTGRPVVAGPVEATGVGNLLVQAMADGRLDGLADIRAVVRASFPLRSHDPAGRRGAAEDAYGRFRRLLADPGASAL
ncbi:rhamnulokinase [Pseudonocardia sp. CA-107938]|uniref:rhamnulokinase n=1 Tax=Pseudonocardia sp. CA-107938 TaxID=3240021 RepID=UPI003D8D7B5C